MEPSGAEKYIPRHENLLNGMLKVVCPVNPGEKFEWKKLTKL